MTGLIITGMFHKMNKDTKGFRKIANSYIFTFHLYKKKRKRPADTDNIYV